MYMYYDNSHLIENNHLFFICMKIAVFSQNYTDTAAKFDE